MRLFAGILMFTSTQWVFDASVRVDPSMPITIEMCRQRDGRQLYAIRQVGACFNREGEWEYEPIPSERDDGFIARCRFETWDDAAKLVERYFKAAPWGRIEQNRPRR